MKKFILTLLVLLTMLFTLTGCSAQNNDYKDYKPQYGPQFICVEKYKDPYLGYTYILVDKNTRVMYMFVDDTEYENRGLSVLYDTEGNVRRYNGAFVE
jgi:hypothetical protein